MIPPLIVSAAIRAGLDLIGITDHNSAENVEAVIEAAAGTNLKVLPGIECEALEGVHLVCLFDTADDARKMQEVVYDHLPNLPNRPETFGAQFVVDATGEFIRYNERLLLVPTGLTIEEVAECARGFNGFVMPAHVDRRSYGIYGVLGFLPETPIFPALEISRHIEPEEALRRYPDIGRRRLFRSSDAHRLSEMGTGWTIVDLPHRTVRDLIRAVDRKTGYWKIGWR
jgi:hypothetical protein